MSAQTEAPELCIDFQRVGSNGTVKITARLGADSLAAEKLDVLKPKDRDSFATRLCESRPGIDRAALDAELLRIAGSLAMQPEAAAPVDPAEVDLSGIVRPELFHHSDVSGLAVPLTRIIGSEPVGRWALYYPQGDSNPCLQDENLIS